MQRHFGRIRDRGAAVEAHLLASPEVGICGPETNAVEDQGDLGLGVIGPDTGQEPR